MNRSEWQDLLAAGKLAVDRGDGPAAVALLTRALEIHPRDRDVRYWLATALRLAGRLEESSGRYRQVLEENRGDLQAALGLAFLLRDQGRVTAIDEVLLAAARSGSVEIAGLLQITGFLRDCNRFDAALAVLDLCLELRPRRADLMFQRARLLQSLGRYPAALADLRLAVEADPALGGAWLALAQIQRFGSQQDADWVRILGADTTGLGDESRMCLAFARGKGWDDLGRFDEAWRNYEVGNRLHRQLQPWDRERWQLFLRGALKLERRVAVRPRFPARHPVFIVGMLRSGTTLLEQQLERHPDVTGRGELNWLAQLAREHPDPARLSSSRCRALADFLWNRLRLDGPEDRVYVDKNPLNFRFLPLLLAVMPEARIIHLVRDGRDSCLSCHFQLFQHPDAAFSSDLEDLAIFYRGYRQLAARGRDLAGDRWTEVRYEDLVERPADCVARLAQFLGLDPAAVHPASPDSDRPIRTASLWQARQPVHRHSLGRWRHYATHAPDFMERIEAIDRQFGA